MKSTEVRTLARVLADEANDLTVALLRGRLRHTCAGGDPAAVCHACDVVEDKRAERRADV